MTAFHDAIDTYSVCKKVAPKATRYCKWQDFYQSIVEFDRKELKFSHGDQQREKAKSSIVVHQTEQAWRGEDRPFFNCWPIALNMITEIKFGEMTLGQLPKLPVPVICICLPVGSVKIGSRELRNVFCAFGFWSEESGEEGFVVFIRYAKDDEPHESRSWGQFMSLNFKVNEFTEGNVELVGQLQQGTEYVKLIDTAMKIAAGCCLLAQDDSMLERRITNKDKNRNHTTGPMLDAAIQRAIKRGLNGWDLGKQLESKNSHASPIPHYRKPHFGIRHTGKGRSTPKLVPIKGAIVKPHKIKIPTGWLDRNDVDQLVNNSTINNQTR